MVKKREIKHNNGEGSVFRRKDGRWVGTITIGFAKDGTQQKKSIYGKTKKEVESKLNIVTNRVRANCYDELQERSAADLMWEWITVFKKNSIEKRTFINIISIFKHHIKPYMKNLEIQNIDDYFIQRVINDLIEKNYCFKTIKKVKFIFNQFLDYAVDSKWITTNPSHRIKIKNRNRLMDNQKYKAIPPEKRQLFLDALNNDPRNYLKYLCYTLMFGGLRIGEALGLMWRNVDLEQKTINVEQAATLEPQLDDNCEIVGYKTILGATKTACSVRNIPIPDILVEALYEWKEKQKQRGKDLEMNFLTPTSYVFCNDNGSIRTYSCCRLCFQRFLHSNNLDNLNIFFHGLRHTFSNILFEARENPKVIQQLLGHRDVTTTISVYNNVDQNYIRQTTERLNQQFKVINPKYTNSHNFVNDKIKNDYEEFEQTFKNTEEQKIEQEKVNSIEDYENYTQEEIEDIINKLENIKKKKQKDYEM